MRIFLFFIFIFLPVKQYGMNFFKKILSIGGKNKEDNAELHSRNQDSLNVSDIRRDRSYLQNEEKSKAFGVNETNKKDIQLQSTDLYNNNESRRANNFFGFNSSTRNFGINDSNNKALGFGLPNMFNMSNSYQSSNHTNVTSMMNKLLLSGRGTIRQAQKVEELPSLEKQEFDSNKKVPESKNNEEEYESNVNKDKIYKKINEEKNISTKENLSSDKVEKNEYVDVDANLEGDVPVKNYSEHEECIEPNEESIISNVDLSSNLHEMKEHSDMSKIAAASSIERAKIESEKILPTDQKERERVSRENENGSSDHSDKLIEAKHIEPGKSIIKQQFKNKGVNKKYIISVINSLQNMDSIKSGILFSEFIKWEMQGSGYSFFDKSLDPFLENVFKIMNFVGKKTSEDKGFIGNKYIVRGLPDNRIDSNMKNYENKPVLSPEISMGGSKSIKDISTPININMPIVEHNKSSSKDNFVTNLKSFNSVSSNQMDYKDYIASDWPQTDRILSIGNDKINIGLEDSIATANNNIQDLNAARIIEFDNIIINKIFNGINKDLFLDKDVLNLLKSEPDIEIDSKQFQVATISGSINIKYIDAILFILLGNFIGLTIEEKVYFLNEYNSWKNGLGSGLEYDYDDNIIKNNLFKLYGIFDNLTVMNKNAVIASYVNLNKALKIRGGRKGIRGINMLGVVLKKQLMPADNIYIEDTSNIVDIYSSMPSKSPIVKYVEAPSKLLKPEKKNEVYSVIKQYNNLDDVEKLSIMMSLLVLSAVKDYQSGYIPGKTAANAFGTIYSLSLLNPIQQEDFADGYNQWAKINSALVIQYDETIEMFKHDNDRILVKDNVISNNSVAVHDKKNVFKDVLTKSKVDLKYIPTEKKIGLMESIEGKLKMGVYGIPNKVMLKIFSPQVIQETVKAQFNKNLQLSLIRNPEDKSVNHIVLSKLLCNFTKLNKREQSYFFNKVKEFKSDPGQVSIENISPEMKNILSAYSYFNQMGLFQQAQTIKFCSVNFEKINSLDLDGGKGSIELSKKGIGKALTYKPSKNERARVEDKESVVVEKTSSNEFFSNNDKNVSSKVIKEDYIKKPSEKANFVVNTVEKANRDFEKKYFSADLGNSASEKVFDKDSSKYNNLSREKLSDERDFKIKSTRSSNWKKKFLVGVGLVGAGAAGLALSGALKDR
jgi:hypothetical protein